MPNILLGDDDEELTQLLQEYLHNHGIQSDCVHDGEAVIERLKVACMRVRLMIYWCSIL